MKVVVDSSSFFYGFIPDSSNDYFTTESVFREIKGRKMKESLEVRAPFLKVISPLKSNIQKIEKIAEESGDIGQLSRTDIDVLALALEISASILTNDLAIQNVCRLAGIGYESFKSKRIKNEITWKYKCEGCGRIYDKLLKECPHCGNNLRKMPVKIKPIR